jgi:hypothetical protein
MARRSPRRAKGLRNQTNALVGPMTADNLSAFSFLFNDLTPSIGSCVYVPGLGKILPYSFQRAESAPLATSCRAQPRGRLFAHAAWALMSVKVSETIEDRIGPDGKARECFVVRITLPRRQRRCRRKPSLATALRQASKAGVKVARAEVGKDGNVVLVFGGPGQQSDPLDAELAEFEARHGR